MTECDPEKSLRQQISHILATGKFTIRQVGDQLGVQSRAEVKKVRNAILELAKEGKAASQPNRGAKLWYLAKIEISTQQKIWRAACLKTQKGQYFNEADLARLAECSRDYVKRYVRFLVEEKYLQPVGLGSAGLFNVWPGKKKLPAPHWNRRAQEREKMKAAGQVIMCSDWTPAGCLGTPQECGSCPHLQELPAPPVPSKSTILDAAVQVQINKVLDEIKKSLNVFGGKVREAKKTLEDMRRDLLQLFAGDPKSEVGDGKSTRED